MNRRLLFSIYFSYNSASNEKTICFLAVTKIVLILTAIKWGALACKITSVHGLHFPVTDSFRPRTASVNIAVLHYDKKTSCFIDSFIRRASGSGYRYIKGVPFSEKNGIQKGKGLDHGAEPPRTKLF